MPRDATSSLIAAAFASWVAEHHPDSPQQGFLSADERTALEREYDRRRNMVATLLDPIKRVKHDAGLSAEDETWLVV